MSEAIAYKVWQVDCHACGTVLTYGSDDDYPAQCEECGEPVEEAM